MTEAAKPGGNSLSAGLAEWRYTKSNSSNAATARIKFIAPCLIIGK